MDPITIRYRLNEPEFMRACGAHWSSLRLGTRANVITGLVGVILGLAMLSFLFWLAIILAAVGGALILITGVRALLWRKAFRDAKKYNTDILVVINEDTVHVESAEGKSDLNWGFFSWYLDTPDYVLLYMTKRSFSVIPKSAFRDARDLQAFVDIVKSKLEKIK
jgi:hypothetical protein